MGRPAHDSAARLIEATGIPLSVDEVLTSMDVKLAELFQTVQPLPGVVKLIKHLKKHNIPMAVRPFALPGLPLTQSFDVVDLATNLFLTLRLLPAARRRTSRSRRRTSVTFSTSSRVRSSAATTQSSRVRASRTRPSSL